MQTILFKTVKEVLKEKRLLEKRLNVEIQISGKKVTIDGSAIDEYEASLVLDAINFGFSTKTALTLKDEDVIFKLIPIKNVTRRKNLEMVKARLIGTNGKTKRAIEQIADCKIVIHDNEVGVIGLAEETETTVTAIQSLIRGSKQSNVYSYLEKMNAARKEKIKDR